MAETFLEPKEINTIRVVIETDKLLAAREAAEQTGFSLAVLAREGDVEEIWGCIGRGFAVIEIARPASAVGYTPFWQEYTTLNNIQSQLPVDARLSQ